MSDSPKRKAVIYARVSSAAQVKKGQGAESQITTCENFAQMRGYQVVKTFKDKGVSGRTGDRPGINQLVDYLRCNRKDNLVLIIDDVSRLARDMVVHRELRDTFQDLGVKLESPNFVFGSTSIDRLNEGLQALFAEFFSYRNSETSQSRSKARLQNGYYPHPAPPGYEQKEFAGQGKILVRKEPMASIIQEALEGYASGRFQSQAEVKRYFESQPYFPRTRHGTVTIRQSTAFSNALSMLALSVHRIGIFPIVRTFTKG